MFHHIQSCLLERDQAICTSEAREWTKPGREANNSEIALCVHTSVMQGNVL